MRTIVSHEVMFLLEDDAGPVVKTEYGVYARLSRVTVHIREGRPAMISAGGIRCAKDGHMPATWGRTHVPVLVDADEWVERAQNAIKGAR